MNTQLTDNEALELKALIAPSYLGKDLGEVKRYLLGLTELDLIERNDLIRLPESIGKLTKLETVNLLVCKNLTTLPESIGKLTKLIGLNLSACENLTMLPESIGKLTELVTLNLSGCTNITTLPESIGKLTKLTNISLSCDSVFVSFIKHFDNLTQFTELSLDKIENVDFFDANLANFTQLEKLNLWQCHNFTILPESIGKLTQLTQLHLSNCQNLITLPECIDKLKQLKELEIFSCHSFTELPKNIGELKQLTKLQLLDCKKFNTLPESIGKLQQLKVLVLAACMELTTLPKSIRNLTQLTYLILNMNKNLTTLTLPESTDDNNPIKLVELRLWDCENITELPKSIGNLKKLTKLNLSGCKKLITVSESIGNLTQLTELDLMGCENLTTLPESIGNLTKLTVLNLSDCKNFTTLPESIQQLDKSKLSNVSLLSIGDVFYRQKEYAQAKEYYSLVKYREFFHFANDLSYFKAQLGLALIEIQEEEPNLNKIHSHLDNAKKSNPEYYVQNIIDKIKTVEDNKKKEYLLNIFTAFFNIRETLLVGRHSNRSYEQSFAHYAKPDIAMKLLDKENNPFRIGSTTFVNDPKEGKVVFDYFNQLKILKKQNIKLKLKSKSPLATFVGCFTFNHDNLNQFRLYGKDNNQEATGVSIVLNADCFSVQHEKTFKKEEEKKEEKEKKNIAKNSNRDKLPLYRCIYLDPKGKLGNKPYIQLAHRDRVTFYRETERKNPKEWKKYKKNIQKSQKNIVKQFAKIKKNIKKLFQQVNKEEKKQLVEIVSFLLLQLSYMVKHSAYQEEQECRIFQFAPFDSDKIKKNIGEKRMYMEYQPIHNYVKKIYLSPYAEQYADMFRALSNGRVEVRSSDNPFR